ncbi:hypothetical protein M3Y99_00700300 [Aphelenchoides fujianensis]|nr:hypothetical protein M3Y99_00700300 [Aphelenchoides fujianensis]
MGVVYQYATFSGLVHRALVSVDLIRKLRDAQVVVYVESDEAAYDLQEFFRLEGLPAAASTARSQFGGQDSADLMEFFAKKRRVLVTSDAAAKEKKFLNISLILNHSMAPSAEVHALRASRCLPPLAGNTACVTFLSHEHQRERLFWWTWQRKLEIKTLELENCRGRPMHMLTNRFWFMQQPDFVHHAEMQKHNRIGANGKPERRPPPIVPKEAAAEKPAEKPDEKKAVEHSVGAAGDALPLDRSSPSPSPLTPPAETLESPLLQEEARESPPPPPENTRDSPPPLSLLTSTPKKPSVADNNEEQADERPDVEEPFESAAVSPIDGPQRPLAFAYTPRQMLDVVDAQVGRLRVRELAWTTPPEFIRRCRPDCSQPNPRCRNLDAVLDEAKFVRSVVLASFRRHAKDSV